MRTKTFAVHASLLATVGAWLLIMPGVMPPAQGQSASNSFKLKGVIRDFSRFNANFAATPSGGNGHYAGNVSLTLPSSGKPAFVGGGYKVASQWKDQHSHSIAPHLYVDPGSGEKDVKVVSAPDIKNNAIVDTFNSSLGPYGPTNKGPAPAFITGSPMPALTEPTGLGALLNEVKYENNGTTTISNSFRTKKFLIGNNRVVKIDGNLTILVTEEFKIDNNAKIEMMSNSSLTMYVKKDCTFQNNVNINMNTCKPALFMLYNLGTKEIMLENNAHVYGRVVSPNAFMNFKNNGHFYGSITAKTMTIENNAGVHIDAQVPMDSCGVELHDIAGAAGITSDGGLVSAARFADWYTDVLGTNTSMPHTINLTKNASGVWEYLTGTFYPIDRKLFGNQGQVRNNYFTYTASVRFVHHACIDTFVEFTGCDDVWVYIDNELVMDRGGVIPNTTQYVDVDRLDLEDGEIYQLHFFYAQRNAAMSIFRLRTNLDLIAEDGTMQVSAAMD